MSVLSWVLPWLCSYLTRGLYDEWDYSAPSHLIPLLQQSILLTFHLYVYRCLMCVITGFFWRSLFLRYGSHLILLLQQSILFTFHPSDVGIEAQHGDWLVVAVIARLAVDSFCSRVNCNCNEDTICKPNLTRSTRSVLGHVSTHTSLETTQTLSQSVKLAGEGSTW